MKSAALLLFGSAIGVGIVLVAYTLFGTLVTLCYLAACIASLQWTVNRLR